ncbi:hypothetical protein GDO78_009009 [Eleutherodactylus coqui]|uniref:Uncharacterized protein n=1 Tax=Eleutherodactylus coqui TaxID=57060 RepID=A0A8J6FDG9_ELECQ|nr:hypothetical protein GDO78_009009 [Eleutherodactylus coqui]
MSRIAVVLSALCTISGSFMNKLSFLCCITVFIDVYIDSGGFRHETPARLFIKLLYNVLTTFCLVLKKH